MNDNVPARLKARYRPGFARPTARFAKASPCAGENPRVEDSWSSDISIAARELDVIETFLGGLLDELLARRLAA